MGIKIIVEGETPLAALADLTVAARYMLQSQEVRLAADNVMEIDRKSITPVSQRTEPPVTLDVGRQPAHHAPAPASGAASAPGSAAAPGTTPPRNGAAPVASPAPGYGPAPGAAPAPRPGNGNAQNPPSPNNGYGSPVNPQNQPPVGVPGGAQGNPTMGEIGANSATTIPTSPSNPQQQYIPGMAPAAQYPGPGSIPVSAAPTFTVAQIGAAGADLVTRNPAKRAELNALLQRYGVQSVSELRPEQLGGFAQELRGMGANI